jgi:diacylglycerol O-acyltransferase / wax synthase
MVPDVAGGDRGPGRAVGVRARADGPAEAVRPSRGRQVLTSLSGFAPPLLLALGGRLAARSPSLGVQTGVTNVLGPQRPLHTLGRRLLESFPFVPLIGNMRISIAIFSYTGGLYFGVTGDPDTSGDIDVLTTGVEHEAAELLRMSESVPARARPPRPAKNETPAARPADAPPSRRA